MHITGLALTTLNLPMRQPFVTALGRKRVSRNLLVTVQLSDGSTGTGEASASLAWPDETQLAMGQALRQVMPKLIGAEIRAYRRLSDKAWEIAGRHPTAVAALECALLDAYTRSRGISLWKWFGGKRRSVTTSLTLSAWPPRTAARAARRGWTQGFRQLKVKVTGKNLDQDIQRLLAIHRATPKATLLVDGNQGFTAKEAVRFCHALRQHHLPVILLEQPVPRADWEGLEQVEKEGGIPVAADESARSVSDARRLIRQRAVSVINVKLAKCGLFGALEIIRQAKASRTRLMIGCMAESAIGLSPSVALACGTGAFDFADLDSHLLVISPPCRPGFSTRGATLCCC